MASLMKLLALVVLALGSGFGLEQALAPTSTRYGTPVQEPAPATAEHKMLQKLAGTWDAVLTMPGPSGEAMKSSGSMVTKKHSDYFVVDEFTADLMGQKFIGHGVHGYCPLQKKYFTHWSDSLSPTPLYATGTYNEKTKELVLTGECQGMSGKLEACRIVTHFVDEDHTAFDMYGAGPDGKEMHFLHIDYTRTK